VVEDRVGGGEIAGAGERAHGFELHAGVGMAERRGHGGDVGGLEQGVGLAQLA